MSARKAFLVTAVLVAVASGCGGSSSEAENPDAQAIVKELGSLREGEIVIKGSSPRVYGPYVLDRDAYVFRFEQPGSGGSPRLVVALESRPRSEEEPYELLVDSQDRSGTRPVTLKGKLYVHVVDAEADYELRFTPRAP